MGFMEILLIAVVAIIALGPEKLPQAMVDAAKFIRAFKKTIDDAKQNITREIQLTELKDEVLSVKNEVQDNLKSVTQINLEKLADLELEPDSDTTPPKPASDKDKAAPQVVVQNAPQSVDFGAFKNTAESQSTAQPMKDSQNV